MAESIPKVAIPSDNIERIKLISGFYLWLFIMMAFDVGALSLGLLKSWRERSQIPESFERLKPYRIWILLNGFVAIIALGFWWGMVAGLDCASTSISWMIFCIALVRSGVDYYAGREFLIP